MRRRPLGPHLGPQLGVTATLLTMLLEEWWLMPPDLVRLVRSALLASRFTRAVTLKQHCAVLTTIATDLDDFFGRVCTPDFTISLLDDLVLEGLLSRQDSSRAQEYVLHRTTRDGAWSAV
jgi:hypothetical protein